MKQLIIVGAGGFGREVFAWASQHPDCGKQWSVAGFLDDNPEALEGYGYPCGVTGAIRDWKPGRDERFVCAIGDPAVKRAVCESLLARGAEFLTLIHPTVVLGTNIKLGRGVVLCPRVTLTADIVLGDFAAVNCHSSIGHDVRVGAWTTISGHCDITGCCELGEESFLGSGARILPGRRLGERAFVGGGAVVIRSVKPGQRVFGNPAKAF